MVIGIGDLVLDQVRAPPRPLGEDDDLDVREIGDRVERRARAARTSPTPPSAATRRIVSHGCAPSAAMTRRDRPRARGRRLASAATLRRHCSSGRELSRLSAAIRKLPEVTTTSPSLSPRDLDAVVRPHAELTSCGRSRPSPRSTKTSRRGPA